MAKTAVSEFDTAVCMGTRADVDGECPHRQAKGESTGHGVVDKLSRIETGAIDRATGGEGDQASTSKCGMCGCPLVNLALAGVAPDECPRLSKHQ